MQFPFLCWSILTISPVCLWLLWPAGAHASKGYDYGNFSTNAVPKLVRRSSGFIKREINRSPYSEEERKTLLKTHNDLRSTTKAGNMLMLEWDSDLEKEAQRWADRCDFNHPKEKRKVGRFNGLGQNLYVSTNEPEKVEVPIKKWYKEIDDYTYMKIRSPGECKPGKACGHYTQIVWYSTEAVGCAIKFCDKLTSAGFNEGYLIVCEYGPPGNMIGRFPYSKSKPCSDCPDEYKHCFKNLCSKRPVIDSSASSLRSQSQSSLMTISILLLLLWVTL